MKKLGSNYDKVPITKTASSGMSWNIYDQLFLKRMFDLQDAVTERYISDTYDTHAQLIVDTVKDMLDDTKRDLTALLNDLRIDIKELKLDVKELKSDVKSMNIKIEKLELKVADHEIRIGHIEKHIEGK